MLGRYLNNIASRFYHTAASAPDIVNAYTASTYQILELIVNRRSRQDTTYQNGTALNTYTYATDISYNHNNTSQLFIGAYGTNLFVLGGNIAEMLSFTNPYDMTTESRTKIEGYLAWKWGLQSNLPSIHPYFTSPP